MAERNNTILLVVVGAVLFIAVGGLGFLSSLGGGGAPAAVPPAPVSVPSTICESSTTPDLDINSFDIENPNNALTETDNIYRKVGDKTWTMFTQGTAITNLQVGGRYEVVMGINTSNFSQSAFGPAFVTDPIPCSEITTLDKGLYNDELAASVTATFYDNNHDATTHETFGTGEVQDVYAAFQSGSDEWFGNTFVKDSSLADLGVHSRTTPNALCITLDTTLWDKPDQVLYNGQKMDRVSTPVVHSVNSSNTAYCYEAVAVDDVKREIVLRLDADDNNNPYKNGTATLYPGGFYINSNGELAWGVETDESIGFGDPVTLTLLLN